MLNRIFQIVLLILIVSCGKSPLQMKKSNDEIQKQSAYETTQNFESSGHQIDLTWLSPISSSDSGHFLLISKKNNIVSDLPVGFAVFLWMPSMGHGSSPVAITKLATGIYDISKVYFIMDGEWQIRVQLKAGSTVLEELNFTYTL
jgi:hypothetical protein